MDNQPITLTGQVIRLEPLSEAHVADLAVAGQDEVIWQYMLYGNATTEAKMQKLVQKMLQLQAQGADLPFAVIHLASGRAIGMTRYAYMRPEHRGLEIGGTWYGVAYQRTAVNTECKYLMLRHAFEVWHCIRVQFTADGRNERSQKALERLGAVKEGRFRHHFILPDGFIRDSVYYSITDSEWPPIKARLEANLEREGRE